jgi:hypothetical protein
VPEGGVIAGGLVVLVILSGMSTASGARGAGAPASAWRDSTRHSILGSINKDVHQLSRQ